MDSNSGLAKQKIAVVGAGTMGSSIAVAFAGAGHQVLLKDADQAALDRGAANLDRIFAQKRKRGLSEQDAQIERDKISLVLDYADFASVDFVVEAAFETLEVKQKIFQELDECCHLDAVLATNTSSLPISRIASFTRRQDKVVGMHFFNPAHVMRLVEVIPGLDTSHETVRATLDLASGLGKLAVRVEECASFLVNRLLGRYMNESLWALQEGLGSVEEIDKAACDFLMPMGPLALRDMNGADIGLSVATYNFKEYGDRYMVPEILSLMVRENLLGQKTMGGFYAYDPETRKRNGENPALKPLLRSIPGHDEWTIHSSYNLDKAPDLFLPMINETFLIMQERICKPEDIDSAMTAGIGMREGPLALACKIGLKEVLRKLESAFEAGLGAGDKRYERFRPAPLLKRFVWAGRTYIL